ncbi:MAG: hypothetical protein JO252_19510 [Planctomycetaceae bacterium]|nr:hypothetical protein [Planctomycetaceae bacterium]MBV8382307.1 hypothetical protein [Planctomycetaceae bacterium]MBV8606936.1 hypothetical protein [Singulisphaera sp.]
MRKKSNKHMAYRSAGEGPRTSPEDLARIRAIPDAEIDTSDAPESSFDPARRVRRDAAGRLPARKPSLIRDAILDELGRRRMTRYELWKAARERCPTLSQSAVYGFLWGHRDIGVRYADALLETLGLAIGGAA